MDELWRLRVKNDAITQMLTGKSWSESAELLRKRYQRVLSRLDKISPEDVFESLMNAYCGVRPAQQLLLTAQLGGVSHSDEPEL
jgi:carboxyl-terminal processing protease